MGNRLAVAICVSTAILLGGCDLYFGGDDEPPPPCDYYTGVGSGSGASIPLRNPENGQCEYQYPDYPCDGVCGPCPQAGADLSIQNWGQCYGHCDGLDEQSCKTTSGCYGAYLDDPLTDGGKQFWGCWDTAPSGPISTGSCWNLDAQGCSEHDNCAATYSGSEYGAKFLSCSPEAIYCQSSSECGGGTCDTSVCYPPPGCDINCPTCGACPDVCYGICTPPPDACTNVDCGPGYTCSEQCYPGGPNNTMDWCEPVCVPDTTCAAVDCGPGYTCAEVCELDASDKLTCHATCVPDNNDPGQCYGTVTCGSPAPACPSGTTPGVKNGCYTGYCIPIAACGPNDPGECYGDVWCNSAPPSCPANTTPGVENGCYTGYCIPTSQCPLQACETLSSENACISRGDCTPVYTGTNCTCYPDHCECEILTYDRCESLLMPL